MLQSCLMVSLHLKLTELLSKLIDEKKENNKIFLKCFFLVSFKYEIITIYNSDSSPSTAYEALMQRETLGATGVGNGVAIPHARLAGIEKVVGAFFKLDKPMDGAAAPATPADLNDEIPF